MSELSALKQTISTGLEEALEGVHEYSVVLHPWEVMHLSTDVENK